MANDKWKEKFQQLLDALNIGYSLQDMNENILAVNETLLRMTGAKREQIVGRNNRDLYSKEEFDLLLEKALPQQEKGFYQFEHVLPTVSGESIPALYNSSINLDENGHPVSINVMITDIREQKKSQAELKSKNETLKQSQKKLEATNRELLKSQIALESEKKKLETTLFGIGDSVTIFNVDGKLEMCNPQGKEIRGGRRKPLLPLKEGAKEKIVLTIGTEQRLFSGQVKKIRSPQGTLLGYVEILTDISDQKRLEEQARELLQIKRKISQVELQTEMVGVSSAMRKVFDLIVRCAEVDSTVLIRGETGVGKELVARAIHDRSARKSKPFVGLNCGALPETLLESELFGYVKGAFTGANSNHLGLFREADGGTLFLDEIGDLSLPLQVKLLRTLQENEVRPVGSNESLSIDVRVIAATNRHIEKMANQGVFRQDLYYRLAVIPLTIPPLRDRIADILPLSDHFIKKHGKKTGKGRKKVNHAAQQLISDYKWPGNIRELENAIEHALAMSENKEITPDDLPISIISTSIDIEGHDQGIFATNDFHAETREQLLQELLLKFLSEHRSPAEKLLPSAPSNRLSDVEKSTIEDVLKQCNGNQSLAAKTLGISRSTLWRKINNHGIHVKS